MVMGLITKTFLYNLQLDINGTIRKAIRVIPNEVLIGSRVFSTGLLKQWQNSSPVCECNSGVYCTSCRTSGSPKHATLVEMALLDRNVRKEIWCC